MTFTHIKSRLKTLYLNPLMLGIVIVLALIWTPKLSYWWDEFSLVQAHSAPNGGILYSHMGHFFPVGRLAFFLEESVFGASYSWMIYINIVVFFTSLMFFMQPLLGVNQGFESRIPLLKFFLAPSLLLSIGIWYDLQWAMQICWFLSILFASLAFASLRLQKFRTSIFTCLFLLSWLSLSSNIIGAAFLIVALGFWTSVLKKIEATIIVVVSGMLTLIGSRLALINPPIDPLAAGWPIDFQNIIANAWEILLLGSTTLTAWLVTPIGILLPSSESWFSEFGNTVFEYRIANFVFILGIMICLFRRVLVQEFELKSLVPITILIGMFMTTLLIVASRYGNTQSYLHIRYAPILQFLSVLFWVSTILTLKASSNRLALIFSHTLLFLFSLTTVISLFNIKNTIESASYVGRVTNTQLQLDQLKLCGSSREIFVYPEIQPSISGETMCKIATTVHGLTD
jgi:hypothetical protein